MRVMVMVVAMSIGCASSEAPRASVAEPSQSAPPLVAAKPPGPTGAPERLKCPSGAVVEYERACRTDADCVPFRDTTQDPNVIEAVQVDALAKISQTCGRLPARAMFTVDEDRGVVHDDQTTTPYCRAGACRIRVSADRSPPADMDPHMVILGAVGGGVGTPVTDGGHTNALDPSH